MSDNKKYYYIKLKDNYFDQDNIRLLEAQENGYIYSLIIIKLYLKSAKHEGRLMMTDRIPYNPDTVDLLAKVINHDVSHVRHAIEAAANLDLIAIIDSGDMWMTEIQNYIGQSSSEADRVRNHRKKIKDLTEIEYKCTTNEQTNVTELLFPNNCTPEKEREIEIKREKEGGEQRMDGNSRYGKNKNIVLSDIHYKILFEEWGMEEFLKIIDLLDKYIQDKGTQYDNHYLALRKWKNNSLKWKTGNGKKPHVPAASSFVWYICRCCGANVKNAKNRCPSCSDWDWKQTSGKEYPMDIID